MYVYVNGGKYIYLYMFVCVVCTWNVTTISLILSTFDDTCSSGYLSLIGFPPW